MQWENKKQSGFTIVELLIVVVVIAILAAISIVAYNGITERARTSAAKSYASQLKHRDLADAQGYWSFDECSGNTTANSAGNAAGATTTISGAISWSNDTPSGSGCSLSFNGSSTFLATNIPLSTTYYLKSAWIKTSTVTGSGQNIISGTGGNGAAFYMTNGRISSGHNGSWNTTQGTQTINDGKWHFVTAEYSSGTMTVTVDGTVVASSTGIPAINDQPGSLQTIGNFNGSNHYTGLIDEPMIITK